MVAGTRSLNSTPPGNRLYLCRNHLYDTHTVLSLHSYHRRNPPEDTTLAADGMWRNPGGARLRAQSRPIAPRSDGYGEPPQ